MGRPNVVKRLGRGRAHARASAKHPLAAGTREASILLPHVQQRAQTADPRTNPEARTTNAADRATRGIAAPFLHYSGSFCGAYRFPAPTSRPLTIYGFGLPTSSLSFTGYELGLPEPRTALATVHRVPIVNDRSVEVALQ